MDKVLKYFIYKDLILEVFADTDLVTGINIYTTFTAFIVRLAGCTLLYCLLK